jgi:hypothetical protein
MKLLIGGKSRNIYMRKDGSAYYKSGGEKVDASYMFKKNGDFKKQYSKSVEETLTKVKESHHIKNNKKFYGGQQGVINFTFQQLQVNFVAADEADITNQINSLMKIIHIAYNIVLEQLQNTNKTVAQSVNKKKLLMLLTSPLKSKMFSPSSIKPEAINQLFANNALLMADRFIVGTSILKHLDALLIDIINKKNHPQINTYYSTFNDNLIKSFGVQPGDAPVAAPVDAQVAEHPLQPPQLLQPPAPPNPTSSPPNPTSSPLVGVAGNENVGVGRRRELERRARAPRAEFA